MGNSIHPLGKTYLHYIKTALRSQLRSDLACRTNNKDEALRKSNLKFTKNYRIKV